MTFVEIHGITSSYRFSFPLFRNNIEYLVYQTYATLRRVQESYSFQLCLTALFSSNFHPFALSASWVRANLEISFIFYNFSYERQPFRLKKKKRGGGRGSKSPTTLSLKINHQRAKISIEGRNNRHLPDQMFFSQRTNARAIIRCNWRDAFKRRLTRRLTRGISRKLLKVETRGERKKGWFQSRMFCAWLETKINFCSPRMCRRMCFWTSSNFKNDPQIRLSSWRERGEV